MVDLGLLVAAGTIAVVLTAKPVSSQPDHSEAEASATIPTAQGLSAEWVSYEEDGPGSQ
jgi:hypothetical protein